MVTLTALDWIALGSEQRLLHEERLQSVNVKEQDFMQATLHGTDTKALCALLRTSLEAIRRLLADAHTSVLQEEKRNRRKAFVGNVPRSTTNNGLGETRTQNTEGCFRIYACRR